MAPAQDAASKLRMSEVTDPHMSFWVIYSSEERAFVVVGKADQAVGLAKFARGETVEEAWDNFNRRLVS